MDHVISDFEEWLRLLEIRSSDLALDPALEEIARSARADLGVTLRFVEVIGRRWSYRAGDRGNGSVGAEAVLIPLQTSWGVVAAGWDSLPAFARLQLVGFLNRLLSPEIQRGDVA